MERTIADSDRHPPPACLAPHAWTRRPDHCDLRLRLGCRSMADDDTVLGTSAAGFNTLVTLSQDDRRRHLHIIGKTGTGKSTLLLSLILSDVVRGRGVAFLDPHGDTAKAVIASTPRHRISDFIYWDPADLAYPIGFNPLFDVARDRRPLVAAHVVTTFKHIWSDSWGPRLEYVLQNGVRLLLDTPESTLLGLPALLVNERYRGRLLARCRDAQVHQFWSVELGTWGSNFKAEALSPLQNKIGALLASPMLRNILGQHRPTLDISSIMNSGRVLTVNLSKGSLGSGPSFLLGALLATAFAQGAETRAAIPEHHRLDFHLYADEFQNFATESFATILSEARKYRLSLTLAHQFLAQLPLPLRQAVMGNAGSTISFRVSADDAAALALEFGFQSSTAFTDLPNFQAWARLIRDGYPSDPIRLTFSPPHLSENDQTDAVIARTRARYARPRAKVEVEIDRFIRNPLPLR